MWRISLQKWIRLQLMKAKISWFAQLTIDAEHSTFKWHKAGNWSRERIQYGTGFYHTFLLISSTCLLMLHPKCKKLQDLSAFYHNQLTSWTWKAGLLTWLLLWLHRQRWRTVCFCAAIHTHSESSLGVYSFIMNVIDDLLLLHERTQERSLSTFSIIDNYWHSLHNTSKPH